MQTVLGKVNLLFVNQPITWEEVHLKESFAVEVSQKASSLACVQSEAGLTWHESWVAGFLGWVLHRLGGSRLHLSHAHPTHHPAPVLVLHQPTWRTCRSRLDKGLGQGINSHLQTQPLLHFIQQTLFSPTFLAVICTWWAVKELVFSKQFVQRVTRTEIKT